MHEKITATSVYVGGLAWWLKQAEISTDWLRITCAMDDLRPDKIAVNVNLFLSMVCVQGWAYTSRCLYVVIVLSNLGSKIAGRSMEHDIL